MDEKMKDKIRKQLSIKEVRKLYCRHDSEKVCVECRKNIGGDVSGIGGDVSGIRGDVSLISGNVSGIWGSVSGIRGDVSLIRGNVSGIWGSVSGIRGDVSSIIEVLADAQQTKGTVRK